jgi:hypothetical protein
MKLKMALGEAEVSLQDEATWRRQGDQMLSVALFRPFFLHHSSFFLRFWVALVEPWGSLGVALG